MRNILVVALLSLLLVACVNDQARLTPTQNDSSSSSADPVKFIDIYVLPYYQAGKTVHKAPRVSVARKYDRLLCSTKQKDILEVRDAILKEPQLITPMTLMVLAIRLYDVGLRDDSVFWFYVAKDRYLTVEAVLDVEAPSMMQIKDAIYSFAALAGPVINGYAFCDLNKQRMLRMKAFTWVKDNPYQALFIEQLPAKSGDRTANLRSAIKTIQTNITKEQDYFSDPKNVAEFYEIRRKNNVPSKYCW